MQRGGRRPPAGSSRHTFSTRTATPAETAPFCIHSGQAGSGMWEFRAGAINRVQHVCVPEAISKIGATSHTGIIGIGVLYFFVARSCLLLNLLAVPKQPTTAWFSRRQEILA